MKKIIFILSIIFISSCVSHKFRKPENIDQARKIISNLNEQFPKLLDSISDTTKTSSHIEKKIEKNDSLKNFSDSLRTIFVEIEKDCPELSKEKEIQYKDRIINNCKLEKKIKDFSFDSSGVHAKLYTDINGDIKLSLNLPVTKIVISKPVTIYRHPNNILLYNLAALCFILLVILLFKIRYESKR